MIRTKRIYLPAESTDGRRILVDRLWPRGVSRLDANLDDWMKEIAPSDELRRWFGHRADRWEEFVSRYRAELTMPAQAKLLSSLRRLEPGNTVTLLYAAQNANHNNAVVVKDVLERCSE